MLQAHSLLWNYLWVAPNLLLIVLGLLIWRRGVSRHVPAFLAFAFVSAVGDLAVFTADVSPVSAVTFWRVDWAYLLVENFLKFVVIGEVFSRVLNPFPSLSRVGRIFVSGFGAALVLLATVVAVSSRGDSKVPLVSGAHLLEQTVFMVELGLIVLIFLFVSYFKLSWDRFSFGVLLGFGVSACAHLAGWAVSANTDLSAHGRTLLDFFDMAVHHLCVLIWGYYLLVPGKVSTKLTPPTLSEHNLDLWNRELERLLQQ